MTVALITISVLVALASNFGKGNSPITQALAISPFSTGEQVVEVDDLPGTAGSEPWRLVTPIFLHFNLLHLLFNAMMLLSLGGQVEGVRGAPRYLALVLVLAVFSNVSEYYRD